MTTTKDLMALVKSKKQALEQQSGRRQPTVKPQNGKSRWRILPGWRKDPTDITFYHDFGQHFIKDEKGEIKAVYICAEKTYGKPCKVCDGLADAVKSADNDDLIKTLAEAKSKGRILMNALQLDGDDASTPVILDLTPTTFEKVLDLIAEHGADFLDLAKGTDIVVTRTGKGLNTEYNVMAAAKSNPVDRAVMTKLHNLDEYVAQEYEQGMVKAINALSTISGRPALMTPATAGLLTGPRGDSTVIDTTATVVDEAEVVVEAPAPAKAPVTPAPGPDALLSDEDPEIAAALAALSAAKAKKAAAAAAAATAPAPAPATAVAPAAPAATAAAPAKADDFGKEFSDADIEKLLGDI